MYCKNVLEFGENPSTINQFWLRYLIPLLRSSFCKQFYQLDDAAIAERRYKLSFLGEWSLSIVSCDWIEIW